MMTVWIFSGKPQIWKKPAFPPEIQKVWAAVAFQAASGIATSTGADVTVTLPVHAANDIFLLQVVVRDVDDTITITGWTEIANVNDGTAKHWWFWMRATGSSETDPLVDKSTGTGDTYATVTTYRGAITSGDPWEAKGTATCTGTTNPFTYTGGVTTLTAGSLVVVSWNDIDNFASSCVMSATDPSSINTDMHIKSNVGGDGLNAAGSAVRTNAGATGDVVVDSNQPPDAACGIVLALKIAGAPVVYSVTVEDGAVDYGIVEPDGQETTLELEPVDTQIVTNTSTGTADFTIMSTTATGGTPWTLAMATGSANEFIHKFSTNGGSNWRTFEVADTPYTFVDSIAASDTQSLDLFIGIPSTTSVYDTKSITVTVQVGEP